MPEISRANCPITGLHCEGRQALIDLQIQIGTDAANTKPNVILDSDGTGTRVLKHLANLAGRSRTAELKAKVERTTGAIDEALAAEPVKECGGTFCGTLGNAALAHYTSLMAMEPGFSINIGRGDKGEA